MSASIASFWLAALVLHSGLGGVVADGGENDSNLTNATHTSTSTSTTGSTTTVSTTTTTTTTWAPLGNHTPFLRLGDGDCLAPASRPVRGVARRDLDHGSCRQFCRGDYCLGYAYSPCQRICTVYGDSVRLLEGREDAGLWNSNSGWDSISHSTGRCGSACFLRANPCYAGSIRSGGAVVNYGNMSFGKTMNASCPLPYRGALLVSCSISGITVDMTAGRCLRSCPGGAYFDRSFEVNYPSSYHGDLASGACPRGAQGNITMRCVDGEARYAFGRCGFNCAPGSMRSGSGIVQYTEMDHQTEQTLLCPAGWTGAPRVRCDDSSVTLIGGRCDKHCVAGAYPVQVGSTLGYVPHASILHNTSVVIPCPADQFSGSVMLGCLDGQVSMNHSFGTCHRHCPPGQISSVGSPDDFASARRNVSHSTLLHETEKVLECNPGFYTYPQDMLYVVGDVDGFIYKIPFQELARDMSYGVALNEYKTVLSLAIYSEVLYVVDSEDYMLYSMPLAQVEPTSFWGEPISTTITCLSVAIDEGVMYVVGKPDGKVYKQSLTGMRESTPWTLLSSDAKNISGVAVYNDTIYAIEWTEKRVYMNDGVDPFASWTGPISGPFNLQLSSIAVAYGYVYITAATNMYKQAIDDLNDTSAWLGPLSNEQRLRSMSIQVVDTSSAVGVWNPGFVGTLRVRCDDGVAGLLEGECRMHCAAGAVISKNVVLYYGNMSHGSNVTLVCPPTHTGELVTTCDDGRTRYEGLCGINCQGMTVYTNGAVVSIPAMPHSNDGLTFYNYSCPNTFYGNISARCFEGEVRWFGYCSKSCSAGRFERASAFIDYPGLGHLQTYTGLCVAKYPLLSYTGSVTFECVDGRVESQGGCYSDCTEGTLNNNGVNINYPRIVSGEIGVTVCEPNEMYGTVAIKCERGFPVIFNGTCGVPCWANLFKAAATRDWPMTLPDIGHMKTRWVTCPPQVSGQLHISCENNIATAIGGSCGDRCPSRPLRVYGASFNSPSMEHLAEFDQPCMPPFEGTVKLRCSNGVLNVTSRCRQGCFASNTTLPGGAFVRYPNMEPAEQLSMQCPSGYAGFVTLECGDVVPFVASGGCYAHCRSSRFYSGIWDVEHDIILHRDTVELPCRSDFDGYVILACDAGVVTLQEGGCFKRCANGRFVVRMGVTMRHASLGHGEVTPSMPCPEGFVGSVRLGCDNGDVAIAEGGCPAHCGSGIVDGAKYSGMLHLTNVSLVCPIAGTIYVGCEDGYVTVYEGNCLGGCEAGTLTDPMGAVIAYTEIDHLGNVTGTCTGDKSGYVQVNCSDGLAMLDPLPGQRCSSHCPDGANLTTSNFTVIFAPPADHGQTSQVKCPMNPGTVTVRCDDGELFIESGVCGPTNCMAGSMEVGETTVPYLEMNDGFESEAPSECPGVYLGEVTFGCEEAVVTPLNVTLIYPAVPGLEAINFSVANATAEFLMEHDAEYFHICGCCIPADAPLDDNPIPGVDLRKVVIWGVGVASSGLAIALASGAWYMRPQRCRKKISRIAPNPDEGKADPKVTEHAVVEYKPKPKPMIRDAFEGKPSPDW